MKFKLLLLVVLLFSLTVAATAQENTPAESPLENACYAGGSLEGKCDWPTDAEDEWAWTCGYHITQFENGKIQASEVPTWCNYFAAVFSPTCYIGALTDIPGSPPIPLPDLYMVAPVNTVDNTTLYVSMDGSCTGESIGLWLTVITSPISSTNIEDLSLDELMTAAETCSALLGETVLVALPTFMFGWNTPQNWWLCASDDFIV